ncbi:hypothetical protein JAE52_003087 [Salmonella enterica]|nr:hypothetical protein [Salmonella enterica]
MHEVCHPQLVGAHCHELTVHPVACRSVFPDAGGAADAGNTLTGRYPARWLRN